MMNKEFLQDQKKKIESKILSLEKSVNESKKYDEIGASTDDNTQEFEEFEEKNALSREALKELEDLKCALGKIEEGKYGICAKCSLPIEESRLKAYPAAIFCSVHAQ